MWIRTLLLIFIGLAGGSFVAAGVFAFLTAIGVVTRLAAYTRTAERTYLYEWCIILGGTLGNLVHLYQFPLFGGISAVIIIGLASGIFVGCLVMSLAETLDVIPTMSGRIKMTLGIEFVILGTALGKMTGALLYFFHRWG